MKRFFTNLKAMATKMLAVALVGVAAVACAEAYDDTDLRNQVADLAQRVSDLEDRLDNEVVALRALIDQKVALAEVAADGAWQFTLADGKTLTLYPEYVENGLTVVTEGGVQYWAKVEGNIVTVLKDAAGNKVAVHNAPVPELRVNAEGAIEVSIDGGATWVATQAPSLFAAIEVKENMACMTLQNGEVLKFALYEQVNFNVKANALFVAPSASEKVAMDLDGVVELIPLVVPAGWNVEVNGVVMTVTAPGVVESGDDDYGIGGWEPLSVDGAASVNNGVIKVLAVSKEGKAMVASLYVTATEAFTSLKVMGETVVLTNNNFFENYYGDIIPYTLAYAIFPSDEYTLEEFVATNPAAWNTTYKYEIGMFEEVGTKTMAVADMVQELCGIESIERGAKYTVVAFDPDAYPFSIESVLAGYYTKTYVDVKMVSSSFKDVQLDIVVEGYDSYEVKVYDLSTPSYYTPEEEFMEMIEYAAYGSEMPWGVVMSGNYSGSLFDIDSSIFPYASRTYAVYVWPKSAIKATADYVWADVLDPLIVKTKGFTAGGMLQPTIGEATIDYQSFMVEVAPAANSYMTYATCVSPASLEGKTDADIVADILASENTMMTKFDPTYVQGSELNPGETAVVVAFSVDEDGKFGPIVKSSVTTKTLDYSTSTLAITNWKLNVSRSMNYNSASYWFGVEATGEVKATYFRLVETNEYMNIEATATEAAVAILNKDSEPTLKNNFHEIAVLPIDAENNLYAPKGFVKTIGGSSKKLGLTYGKTYMIIVAGEGADGLPVRPAYYTFDTFEPLSLVYADDAKWTASKPVVTISENMTTTTSYLEMYGEEYTLTGEALTYPAFATKEVTIKLAEGCTELIVGCMGSDYVERKEYVSARVYVDGILGEAEEWPEDGKLSSNTYYNYKGGEVTFTSCEFATWVSYYVDITWRDAEGNWYETVLDLLHEQYEPEGLPDFGGGGIGGWNVK